MCTFGLSKTCTFERPGASNTTKIPREDTQRETKRAKMGAGERKSAKFWAPRPSGPRPAGPHPSRPTLQGPRLRGPRLRGPTLRGPTFSRFGPPALRGPTLCGPKIQHPKISRSRNWPNSKKKLAEVKIGRSRQRSPPHPIRRTAKNVALVSPLPPPTFALSSFSLGVLSLNFGGVFDGQEPEMCTFGLGLSLGRLHMTARKKCTFHGSGSTRRPQKREERKKIVAGEVKKMARHFGPPTLRSNPHPSGPPTLRGPHPSGHRTLRGTRLLRKISLHLCNCS